MTLKHPSITDIELLKMTSTSLRKHGLHYNKTSMIFVVELSLCLFEILDESCECKSRHEVSFTLKVFYARPH